MHMDEQGLIYLFIYFFYMFTAKEQHSCYYVVRNRAYYWYKISAKHYDRINFIKPENFFEIYQSWNLSKDEFQISIRDI